ncbi:MAG6090-like repeat-containing lipoprotein [Mycoplasmopsis bovis]|uniref:Uncharacterized protein n=2 Tax=Mycoplasmopsis bovis TaxID=28903 RepID=A0A454AP90_MYCBG|nr:hypothetical protein [Mycoplasmopsis bovis]ADR24840.1 hypothetical protein MBOVPG45_0048 [Mycoplasmopsis bovis PG45]UTW26473.1 hypothetical protein L8F43_01865 [Mycoplasmopsis bovis]WHL47981.1 hypothetical protein HYE50_00230 [Mycoplasmopsis bovis]
MDASENKAVIKAKNENKHYSGEVVVTFSVKATENNKKPEQEGKGEKDKKPGEGQNNGKPGEDKPNEIKPNNENSSQSNGNNNHNNSNRPIPKLDRQSLLMNTYRDSISGLDIELHPTGEQIKKEKKRLTDEVKKILDQNLKNNKVFWAEAAASNSTAKIFDDTYTDQKNKALDKQKRREQDEARRQYYHKYQSSEATMRLFDDEYTDLVEEALNRQMYREQEAYFKGLMHEYYSAAHTKDLFELLTKQIDHKSNKKAEFRKQIEKLTAEKLKLEKEFAELETKSEKEEERLRESYESQLVQVVDAYEEEKALLVKQRDLINKKISDLLTKQDEINKSKAGIQDVKDLIEALRDAESSNKEYQDFIDDLETKIKEAEELSAKTMDLERKIEELRSLISSSWQEQKDKAEKSWKEEKVKTESIQKDLKKELKEVEEESKTLKRLKRDLTENFSDSFFINPNENEGFNHQIIEEIDKDILIAEHEKKELYALVAEANKKVLEKAYIYCELLNAEGKLKILEQYNKKLQKQLNEIRAYVAENSLKRSSAEELAKLFADNIEKLQELILKSLQASQSVSEHEQTLELLESEKDSINKSLDELESRFEKQKTNLLDNLDESILDLSFEYEDLEELKLEEIKEKEAQIKQNEESIQKLKK